MTAHAILGCCWHHAHALESHTHATADAQQLHDSCHCDEVAANDVAHDVNVPGPARDEHNETCDDSSCKFVRTDSASTPDDLYTVAFGSDHFRSAPGDSLSDSKLSATTGSENLLAAPSVRAHLLLQILLL